jgi:hypothetical protein
MLNKLKERHETEVGMGGEGVYIRGKEGFSFLGGRLALLAMGHFNWYFTIFLKKNSPKWKIIINMIL